MSRDEGEAEDVTGLFRKFGGDASSYREFEPAPEPEARQVAWALVPGGKPAEVPGAAAPAVAAPVIPAPAVAAPKAATAAVAAPSPAVFPDRPAAVAVPFPASPKPVPGAAVPAPVPTDSASPTAAAARPLDLLFARLAGTTGQDAPSQGLLSRWRRPS